MCLSHLKREYKRRYPAASELLFLELLREEKDMKGFHWVIGSVALQGKREIPIHPFANGCQKDPAPAVSKTGWLASLWVRQLGWGSFFKCQLLFI